MLPQPERKTVLALSFIYAFRMLGLFMILPIFSLYTHHFAHSNEFLIGVALGVYGLVQAVLQIPFGMTSDRIGRKPVIFIGLILFALGSVVAAEAHSIYQIILGRALQGAGAVGSTLTALVADSTKDEHRLKAMSMIGMTIGLAFVLAMILGPVFNGWVGLSGIFWFIAILAILGIVILFTLVPTPKKHFVHRDSEPVLSQFKMVLSQPELLRLDFGIFAAHAILTALFITVPIVLVHGLGLQADEQWWVYLPVLILSFFAMVPFVIVAEKKRKMKPVFVGAVLIMTLVQFVLWLDHQSLWLACLLLFLFFTAFTLSEATLPSLIAKIAPAGSKGTAMGVYSSCQFLGIFVGGLAGGFVFHHFGVTDVFLLCGGLSIVWLIVAMTMRKPLHLSSKIISLPALATLPKDRISELQCKLKAISGVHDVMVYPDEQVAYLKVEKEKLDEKALEALKN